MAWKLARSHPLVPVALVLIALPMALLAACGDDDADAGSPSAASVDPATADLRVEARDIDFDADAYSVSAGTVSIAYVEAGKLVHDLVIERSDGERVPIEGGDDEAKLVVTTAFDSAGTAELSPGTYTLVCTVPGHEQAGMKAALTVT